MNLRLSIVCLATAAVGLSMVIVSISKLLLFLAGLTSLLLCCRKRSTSTFAELRFTPTAILSVLALFSLSLLWTTAPDSDALGSLAKYGKLLAIMLVFLLIKTRQEALYAATSFFAAQCFLLASSWILFFGAPVPWATSNMALTQYAVFSSYLDQGIISAVFAALCWHLRELMPGRYGKPFVILLIALALSNVFFVLKGRTGHVVAIALISLAAMWELPTRYRCAAFFLPFLLVFALTMGSGKLRERFSLVTTELQAYSSQQQSVTSSGIRLGLWSSSIQMMQKHAFLGTGVGSWSTEYNRLQREKNPQHEDIQGNFNPHNEYLLWSVQLGFAGVFLYLALLCALIADAQRMRKNEARALFSAVMALAIAGLFNSSLYDSYIGDFFCIVIGLLLALGLRERKSKNATAPVPGAAA